MKRENIKIQRINMHNLYEKHQPPTHYYDLDMENGDKINIGLKNEVKTGDVLNYEIIGDKKTDGSYQQEYPKAKRFNPQWKSNKSGYDVKGVQAGHAVTGAIYLMTSGIDIIDEDIQTIGKSNYLYKTALKVAEITETVKNKL